MYKKPRFRTPFDSLHVIRSQNLLKSARQHFSLIFSSLWQIFSWKISLVVMCETYGPFVDTLIDYDKHSLLNRENLPQPIQMQLSNKHKFFRTFLQNFWNLHQIYNILKKRWVSYLIYFWYCRLRKTWLIKCLKRSNSEHPSNSQHNKGSGTLLKSVLLRFYQIYSLV